MDGKLINELEQKYSVIDLEKGIEVYSKDDRGNPILDIGLKLMHTEGIWSLFLIQRDHYYNLLDFKDKEMAKLALYIACDGKLEQRKTNTSAINYLKCSENKWDDKVNFFFENINKRYISFDQGKKGAFSLEEKDSLFSVYYLNMLGEKKYITKKRPVQPAIVTMYNFAMQFQEFDVKFKPVIQHLNLETKDIELLKLLYIGK